MKAWLLLLCLGQGAPAQPSLEEAITLFNEAEFEKARAELSRLLYPRTLLSPKDTLTAHAYLAAALLAFEEVEAARRELRALLELDPDHALSQRFDPRLRTMAEALRAEVRPPPAPPPQPPPGAPPRLELKVEPAPEVGRFRWHRLLPFGVAQFIDGRPALGAVYSVLGAGSLAANLTFGALLDKERDAGRCASNCTRIQLAQNLFFGAIIAVGVWSVIDALLFSP